jgi:hypothetical protein
MPDISNNPNPDQNKYREFIAKTELSRVRLISANVAAILETPAASTSVDFNENSTYEINDHELLMLHNFKITFSSDEGANENSAEIEVNYQFFYHSDLDLQEYIDCIEAFKEFSFPITSWPFIREFIFNMMGRFGWPPYTLPLIKWLDPEGSSEANPVK